MKLPHKLFLIATCLIVLDASSVDDLTIVKTLNLFIPKTILAKVITCMAIVAGEHISTNKVIWEGKIGNHPTIVIHENLAWDEEVNFQKLIGFNFNGVSYKTAVSLWEKNHLIFEKILPYINDTKPIEIRMCTNGFSRSNATLDKHLIWVGNDIASITSKELEFIIAHEVGHFMLYHHNQIPKSGKGRRIIEKQADIRAVKILNSADGGLMYFTRYAYPKNPITRLASALRNKFYGATTHPLYPERIKYLQHWKTIHERGKANH